jgi:hypothetical protein
MPSELSVLRRPAPGPAARPPTGARHRSGSGNAITELGHHIGQGLGFWPQNAEHGHLGLAHRVSALSLTVWSSRHQQAPLVGTLRASHSGAACRGR